VVCRTLLSYVANVVCSFSEVFYANGKCLLYFYHAKEVLNHPDNCYMCGELTFKSQRQNFTPLTEKCRELYFGWKVGDQLKKVGPFIFVM
jgi:hypothetical protein